MTDPIPLQKAHRRREALRLLGELSPGCRGAASARITRWVLESPAWTRARTVHTYVGSLPGEIDTHGLIDAARAQGKRVLVPVLASRRPSLRHAEIGSPGELSRGPLGLLQPRSPRFVEPAADLVLVPGLLFDRRGCRIGRGVGYYDRFLAGLAGGEKIGLIYDELFVDRVPTEGHDVVVDAVATPSGLHPRRDAP